MYDMVNLTKGPNMKRESKSKRRKKTNKRKEVWFKWFVESEDVSSVNNQFRQMRKKIHDTLNPKKKKLSFKE